MSATTASALVNTPPAPTKSHVQVTLAAFWALMRRDLLVTAREFVAFLIQVVLQPMFFLFVFGKVIPTMGGVGGAMSSFGALLLPGIVAFTVLFSAVQGTAFQMVLELGYTREIDDRLLAPLPVSLVAIQKVVMSTLRGLVAGTLIFPLGWWILGDAYQVRTDEIGLIILLMVLAAIMGSALGLVMGTVVQPEQIGVIFGLVFTPLIFTGCVYNPWGTLSIKWFQIVTLFNPLTYASEGLRNAMLPVIQGHTVPTLDIGWVLLGLISASIVLLIVGIRLFYRRVVS